jgi:hypothetical protein
MGIGVVPGFWLIFLPRLNPLLPRERKTGGCIAAFHGIG